MLSKKFMKTSQLALWLIKLLILLGNSRGSSIPIINEEANKRKVSINIEADPEKDGELMKQF